MIATDDKQHARLAGLRIVAEEVGKGQEVPRQSLDPGIADAAFSLWGWKPGNDRSHKDKKKKDNGDNN